MAIIILSHSAPEQPGPQYRYFEAALVGATGFDFSISYSASTNLLYSSVGHSNIEMNFSTGIPLSSCR